MLWEWFPTGSVLIAARVWEWESDEVDPLTEPE
jgi:hypothetical protein